MRDDIVIFGLESLRDMSPEMLAQFERRIQVAEARIKEQLGESPVKSNGSGQIAGKLYRGRI